MEKNSSKPLKRLTTQKITIELISHSNFQLKLICEVTENRKIGAEFFRRFDCISDNLLTGK